MGLGVYADVEVALSRRQFLEEAGTGEAAISYEHWVKG
jgi:hypothetical protein